MGVWGGKRLRRRRRDGGRTRTWGLDEDESRLPCVWVHAAVPVGETRISCLWTCHLATLPPHLQVDARGPQLYLADPSGTYVAYDAHVSKVGGLVYGGVAVRARSSGEFMQSMLIVTREERERSVDDVRWERADLHGALRQEEQCSIAQDRR